MWPNYNGKNIYRQRVEVSFKINHSMLKYMYFFVGSQRSTTERAGISFSSHQYVKMVWNVEI